MNSKLYKLSGITRKLCFVQMLGILRTYNRKQLKGWNALWWWEKWMENHHQRNLWWWYTSTRCWGDAIFEMAQKNYHWQNASIKESREGWREITLADWISGLVRRVHLGIRRSSRLVLSTNNNSVNFIKFNKFRQWNILWIFKFFYGIRIDITNESKFE